MPDETGVLPGIVVAVGLVLVASLAAAPLAAQEAPRRQHAFVDVSFGADADDAQFPLQHNLGRTVATGLALGFDFARSGIEFGVGVPQWHVEQASFADSFLDGEGRPVRHTSSSTVRRRSIDLTLLHRSNIPIRRAVTLTWLIGAAYVYRPVQTTISTQERLPDGRVTENATVPYTHSHSYPAAVSRFDVEWQITSHVDLVPRLRLTMFPIDEHNLAAQPFVLRPEVAGRWRF